jgi:hypothetical protein
LKNEQRQTKEVESEEQAKLKQIIVEFEKRKRDDLRHKLKEDQ